MYRVSDKALPMRRLAKDYAAGSYVARHSHRRGQLLYAASGVMRVTTRKGIWIVPPQRAVWIPARMPHEIRMEGAVAMRTLYLDRRASARVGPECKILVVSSLVRELVLGLMEETRSGQGERGALMTRLLLRELSAAEQVPLHIPTATDQRLQRVCKLLLEGHSTSQTLEQLAQHSGASSRTLARLFKRELKMTFRRWRQHANLARGLSQLAGGASVKSAARDAGYDSASAFTAMFRRTLGLTPTLYLRQHSGSPARARR